MSAAFKLFDGQQPSEQGLYLGPARVLEVAADQVALETPAGRVVARLALGYA